MIAANYFSAWVGGVFIISKISATYRLDLYNAWRWLWCIVAVSYLITLVFEWPFVAFCLRNAKGWFRKSIWARWSCSRQATWFFSAGIGRRAARHSIRIWRLFQPAAISLPRDAMLYYIDENDRDVYVRDLAQPETRKISERCT